MESITVMKKKVSENKENEVVAKIVNGFEDVKAGRVKEWKTTKK